MAVFIGLNLKPSLSANPEGSGWEGDWVVYAESPECFAVGRIGGDVSVFRRSRAVVLLLGRGLPLLGPVLSSRTRSRRLLAR